MKIKLYFDVSENSDYVSAFAIGEYSQSNYHPMVISGNRRYCVDVEVPHPMDAKKIESSPVQVVLK